MSMQILSGKIDVDIVEQAKNEIWTVDGHNIR